MQSYQHCIVYWPERKGFSVNLIRQQRNSKSLLRSIILNKKWKVNHYIVQLFIFLCKLINWGDADPLPHTFKQHWKDLKIFKNSREIFSSLSVSIKRHLTEWIMFMSNIRQISMCKKPLCTILLKPLKKIS